MIVDEEATASTVPAGLVLATIKRRAIGSVIDELLVVIPVAIGVVLAGFRPGDTITDDMLLALNVSSAALAMVYDTVLIGVFGRTVGKFVTGTRVVRRDDGGRVGWYESGQRAVVPVAAGAVPRIGLALTATVYSVALLGPLRQGIHDRAAGTIVIDVRGNGRLN